MKIVRYTNSPDKQDDHGNWLKSYREKPFVQHETRSSAIWRGINTRCNVSYQNRKSNKESYTGCINLFKDYNSFTEWCQTQFGYMNKEDNGNYWAIDKDLLGKFSKSYSPDSCMFIPQRVNNLMTLRGSRRGRYPIGVVWHKRDKIFEASCNNGLGKLKYLGRFDNQIDAHIAWAIEKRNLIIQITKDPDFIRHKRLLDSLDEWVCHFTKSINDKTEINFDKLGETND